MQAQQDAGNQPAQRPVKMRVDNDRSAGQVSGRGQGAEELLPNDFCHNQCKQDPVFPTTPGDNARTGQKTVQYSGQSDIPVDFGLKRQQPCIDCQRAAQRNPCAIGPRRDARKQHNGQSKAQKIQQGMPPAEMDEMPAREPPQFAIQNVGSLVLESIDADQLCDGQYQSRPQQASRDHESGCKSLSMHGNTPPMGPGSGIMRAGNSKETTVPVMTQNSCKLQAACGLPPRQNGFTLIEIMVVVVILGILAALVVPNILGNVDEARATAAQQDIRAIESALDMFRLDNFRYPTTEEGLEALVTRPVDPNIKKWKPYLKKLPNDPWGNPYQYLSPGTQGEIDIYSFGADGQPGGDGVNADVGNWSSN